MLKMFYDIQKLFLKGHGSFSKSLQFNAIVIFVLVIIFLTTFFDKSYGFVIILIVFALYISNTYVSINNDEINDFNKITMYKLQKLQEKMYDHINYKQSIFKNTGRGMSSVELNKLYKYAELNSLYTDADLIVFLFSIIKLYEYNPYLYFSLLKGTDNILGIKKTIDDFYESNGMYPENTSELFESALSIRSNSINNLHDMIYNVPKTNKMYDYIGISIDRYATLISRVTDSIYKSYKSNIDIRGINNTTKFVTYNTTKHLDPMQNHSIIPEIKSDNNIPFYI